MTRLERKKPSEIRGHPDCGKRLQWKPGFGPLEARIPRNPEPKKNIVPNTSSLSPAQVAEKMKAEKKKKETGKTFEAFCRGISEIVMIQVVNSLNGTDSFIRINAANLLEDAAKDGVDISVALDALHNNLDANSRVSDIASQALTYHYVNKKDWSPVSALLKHPNVSIVENSLVILGSTAAYGSDIRPMLSILTSMLGKKSIQSEILLAFRFAVKNETSRHDAIYFLVKSLGSPHRDVVEHAEQIILDSIDRDKKIARETDYTLDQWLRMNIILSSPADSATRTIKSYCSIIIDRN